MSDVKVHDWQVPPFEASPGVRQDWVESQTQDGEQWWQAQQASSSEPYLALLSSKGQQKLQSNSLKSDIRKFVETISDIREIGTYGTTATQFKKIADNFNQLVKNIYLESHFPRQTRKALQFAVGLARGYLWPRYIRSHFGWGEGVVEFKELGPREVLPSQVPTSGDTQGCYAETIIECLGIAEAHARFPRWQEQLQPISKFNYTSNNQVRRHEFWDRWRYGEEQKDWERQYCEIRYTFIRDLRINRTGRTLEMGEKDTSWAYSAPAMGSQIVSINPNNNLPQSRDATEADCRVYPQLRLIISNPGMAQPMYDGPAFDWHGEMPAVQYDVDDWPWLAVGYSLLHDVAGPEKALRIFMDLMYRVLKRKMNPALAYDLDAGVPREDIKRFNWLDEDLTSIGVSGDPEKILRPLIADHVDVTDKDYKMVELLGKLKEKTLGLNDLGSLAQLKFNISGETADKLLETIGPIAKGISGNVEIAHAKIAQMLKFIIMQYYDTPKVLSKIGPENMASEVFDLKPGSMVPSHLPGESKEADSPSSKLKRSKWMAQNLKLISVPSSLIQVTQMQEQLKWLNFLQRGFPVSFSTAFKKLGVDNWGESPGDTEFEKWKFEQTEMLEIKAKLAQVAAVELPGAGEGDGKGAGKGKGGGRPPTGQQPPKLEKRGSQSGNLRTVVSQSK